MTFQHSLTAHFLPCIAARRVVFELPHRQGMKNANKACHPTARSRHVEVSIFDFTAPPPFPHSPPLLAVDAL